MNYLAILAASVGRAVRGTWTRLLSSKKAVFGAGVILFLILVALFAPIIAPGNPNANVAPQNLPPSLHHLLGTTGQGNDLFAQLVWGTRTSLAVGFFVGVAITIVAVAIGLSAAYFGGWV